MNPDESLHCIICGDVRVVDIPQCADSLGADCSERACRECGAALFVDPVTRTRPAAARAA